MCDLQKKVDQALDTAVFENEYVDLMSRFPMEVAVDLCTFSSELEDDDVREVASCVLDYQRWYASTVHEKSHR